MIVPIWKSDDDKAGVLNAASSVKEVLHSAGIKVKFDDSDQKTPGWKYNFWEMKVCPISKRCTVTLLYFIDFHLG